MHLLRPQTAVLIVLSIQAALKAFDDDHNGALDEPEFERFAKSLMKSGKQQLSTTGEKSTPPYSMGQYQLLKKAGMGPSDGVQTGLDARQ